MTKIEKISKAWHEAVVDYELMHPNKTLGEVAEYFGVTQAHLSQVRSSDAFLEYRAIRVQQHHDFVSDKITRQAEGLAETSLDVLQTRIHEERESIGLGIVRDAADLALKSLGYGPKPINVNNFGGRTEQHFHLNESEREHYQRAQQKLRSVNKFNTENAVDADFEDVTENANAQESRQTTDSPGLLEAGVPHSVSEDDQED